MAHRPRRRFGQHFLHDRHLIERMLAAIAPSREDAMVEIGPGLGALTAPLLDALDELTALELDRDLLAPVEALASQRRATLHLYQRDALSTRFEDLRRDQRPLRLVGNLPYNISTPLLFHVAGCAPGTIRDMHFLLQKEVVQRMAAAPGSGVYGRLSVMLQYRCSVEPLFEVPKGAFRPAPTVTSSFVRLTPHTAPPVDVTDEAALARVVARAFAQRRKRLGNALKGVVPMEAIRRVGVDPSLRPERLALSDFARLANALADMETQSGVRYPR